MRRQRNLLGPQGMGGMVSLWGASSLIRSVQSGTITIAAGATTNTATIASVNLANAFVEFNGVTSNSESDGQTDQSIFFTDVALTNATTVTATKNSTDISPFAKIVAYTVVEYAPGVTRSIQRGIITYTGLSATTTITAVNPSTAYVVYGGNTTSYTASTSMNTWGNRIALTNATTVTATSSSSQTYSTAFSVVDFF